MSEFWKRLIAGHTDNSVPGAVDQRIQSKAFGEAFESVRSLTDTGRVANALQLPVDAGTKVSFIGTLGAVLTYDDPPEFGELGEVVAVRSANGDLTSHEGRVFVKWASGKLIPVYAEHLRRAKENGKGASGFIARETTESSWEPSLRDTQLRVASLGDLSGFFKVADNTLVHKSTKDLWSFEKDADGGIVVKRMFDGDGKPLKG